MQQKSKKLFAWILAAGLLFVFGACSDGAPQAVNSISSGEVMNTTTPEAVFIRVGIPDQPDNWPVYETFTTTDEMTAFYTGHQEAYGLGIEAFTRQMEEYDQGFFQSAALLCVFFGESSGSIGHTLEKIEETPDGELLVVIQRQLPEIGTMDLAQWVSFITIPANAAGLPVRLEFVDVGV